MADLEQHQPNQQSDDEHPMPSVRCAVPTKSQLASAQYPFLELKPNNHHLNFATMKTEHPVVLDILKGHPLAYALTATANVPLVYLRQFWNTLIYLPEENNYRFEAFVDHYRTKLNKKRLRLVLHLPNKNDLQGKEDFDEFVSEDQLCADIRSLGYKEPLTTSSMFKRMHLPPIWYTLFSILNRCLTPKHTGIDRCNLQVLRLFHGVAFNMDYDYATIFWNELVELVSDKDNAKARKFVPYQRFLQLIIHNMMCTNLNIPSRSSAPLCREYEMKYLKSVNDEGIFPLILYIPDELLAYADQDAQSVREYREYKASLVQPGPEGPPNRRGDERSEDIRVSDRGAQRENENERGNEGDGGASMEETSTHFEQDIPEEAIILIHSSSSDDDERIDNECTASADDIVESADNEEAIDESDSVYSVSLGDDDTDNDNDDDPDDQMSESQIDIAITQTTQGVEEVIEGELVENSETLNAGKEKEHGERVAGSEEQNDPSQKNMDPVVHSQSTPPSLLSGSHLENLDIETGRQLLHSPTSIAAQVSLEPNTLLGTQSSTDHFGNVGRTSRIEPSIGIMRGHDGGPTRVNIMPTLNVGHTVHSNLSDSGVIFSDFVTREYLDSALKTLKDSFADHFDSLKRIYKGKAVDSPPQPQAKTIDDISVDELKSLLYAKLLSQESELDPSDSELLGVLRRTIDTEANVVTIDHFNSFKEEIVSNINNLTLAISSSTSHSAIQQTLHKLVERVQLLEETCREHATSRKRKR